MLRKLYRAIVLAQAASAANKTLATMSDRILDDIGQSRDSFAHKVSCKLFPLCFPTEVRILRINRQNMTF